MPNGSTFNKEEWERLESPLRKIDYILENYASINTMVIRKNYHNWPERTLKWGDGVIKEISIYLKERETQKYNFCVSKLIVELHKRYFKNIYLKVKVPFYEIQNNIDYLLKLGKKRADSIKNNELEYIGIISYRAEPLRITEKVKTIFGNRVSIKLAKALANRLKCKIEECNINFGIFTKIKICMKCTYKNMILEIYFFNPYIDVWVTNFNIKKEYKFVKFDESFLKILNDNEIISDKFCLNDLQKFCKDSNNKDGLINLEISSNEYISLSSNQIILRNMSKNMNLLIYRFDILSEIFKRNKL